jgi:hypothetical protein
MKTLMITLVVLASTIAKANRTYNECVSSTDSQSGIYFEDGYEQYSPNSSEHPFANIVFVNKGAREALKIAGDYYRPDCYEQEGGSSQLSLDRSTYVKLDITYKCGDGSSIKAKIDLDSAQKPNGAVTRTYKDGRQVSFDLNCR